MIKFNFKRLALDCIKVFLGFLIFLCLLNLVFSVFVGITNNSDTNPVNHIEQKIEKELSPVEFLDKNFKSTQADLKQLITELGSLFTHILLITGITAMIIAVFKIIAYGFTQKEQSILFFSLMTFALWIFVKIALFDLGEEKYIGFDVYKFTDFIKSGFYYIYIGFLIIVPVLKIGLVYVYVRSKNLYRLSNCYIKAYNNNSEMLDYFDCEQKINPNDMGRNLAKYFI